MVSGGLGACQQPGRAPNVGGLVRWGGAEGEESFSVATWAWGPTVTPAGAYQKQAEEEEEEEDIE